MFRPFAVFRIVEPLSGSPRVRVSCKPIAGWNREASPPTRGNSHLRYEIRGETLRLLTNMPLTYLNEESAFVLNEKVYFALTWGWSIEEDLGPLSERFLHQTLEYWKTWVKHCSIPTQYQSETIRSALALKLHCYEDTGAILAAPTTSLPEKAGSNRNWDYRFCWLRDAYFALTAFHNLGHFEEMEAFIKFVLDIAHSLDFDKERLRPVYSLARELPIPETEHAGWRGFSGSSPVRSNNQAAEHIQNDVYGEMILALSPIYFDNRFVDHRTAEHERLMTRLAQACAQQISRPDAGLWEIRNGWQEHSFTNLMCWAGLERVERIMRGRLGWDASKARDLAYQAIHAAVKDGSIRNGPKDASFDAALSQAAILRFPDLSICKNTCDAIAENLQCSAEKSGFYYRYIRKDDFGSPESAFLVCSFWLAQAYALTGNRARGAQIMNSALRSANPLGLMSEHYEPVLGQQLGNFPQAYSHVGLINAAFALSPPWHEVL